MMQNGMDFSGLTKTDLPMAPIENPSPSSLSLYLRYMASWQQPQTLLFPTHKIFFRLIYSEIVYEIVRLFGIRIASEIKSYFFCGIPD